MSPPLVPPLPAPLPRPTKFRTAGKIPLFPPQLCMVFLVDNSTTVTLKAYSQAQCKDLISTILSPGAILSFVPDPALHLHRTSPDKPTSSKFYTALITAYLNTATPVFHAAMTLFANAAYQPCVDLTLQLISSLRSSTPSPLCPSVSSCYSLAGDAYTAIGKLKAGRAAGCYTMAAKTSPDPPSAALLLKLRADDNDDGELQDIESLLANHSVLSTSSKFKFSCTGCGECCRTSDNILLTPYDIFNMSRSENVAATTSVLHERFSTAFKYMLNNEIPICYLRPVKSELGHCHFAFPLYKDKEKQLLSYSQTKEQLLLGTPLSPVLNSFSKPALGCLLGVAGMPSMCSSYPVANEIVFGDFWHERQTPEAATWVNDEKWVVVKNDACEGFYEDDQERTQAYAGQPAQEITIQEFLDSGTDLRTKEIKKAWFLSLHGTVVRSGVVQGMKETKMRTLFIEQLARIWFDFDRLQTSRIRAFKRWDRVQRVIEEHTKMLTEQTVQFMERERQRGEEEEGGVARFTELLRSLNF